MGHSSEVVDLIGTNVGNDGDKICCITKISVVKEKFDSSLVSVLINMVNTSSIERR